MMKDTAVLMMGLVRDAVRDRGIEATFALHERAAPGASHAHGNEKLYSVRLELKSAIDCDQLMLALQKESDGSGGSSGS